MGLIQRFASVPAKIPDGVVDIGAVVRLAPIKDITSMLYAFTSWVTGLICSPPYNGGVDDEEYAQECYDKLQMQLIMSSLQVGWTSFPIWKT